MFNASISAPSAPVLGVLAQLDVGGFLFGPDGRSLFANLVSSVLIQFLNGILGLFLGTTAA